MTWEEYKNEWISHNTCRFCPGSHMHTCTSYSCSPTFRKAKKYFSRAIARDEVAAGKRKFIIELTPHFTEENLERYMVSGAWIIRNFKRKELVIRFHESVPEMQQSACVLFMAEKITDDDIKVRAWRPEDRETIRKGIPCGDIQQGEMQQSEVPTLKG